MKKTFILLLALSSSLSVFSGDTVQTDKKLSNYEAVISCLSDNGKTYTIKKMSKYDYQLKSSAEDEQLYLKGLPGKDEAHKMRGSTSTVLYKDSVLHLSYDSWLGFRSNAPTVELRVEINLKTATGKLGYSYDPAITVGDYYHSIRANLVRCSIIGNPTPYEKEDFEGFF